MKKILSIISFIFLILLVGCQPDVIKHPVIDDRTLEETQTLINTLQESTVSLVGYYMEFETSLGSGFIFMREEIEGTDFFYYYVATNNHVVKGVTHVEVRTQFDIAELGDIYGFPTEEYTPHMEDIAIVRFISDFDYPLINIIPLNEDEDGDKLFVQLSVGQTVFGIGTPINTDNKNLVTDYGIITELSGNFVIHTSNINPGNSGGPLFSYDGTFIGINTQRLENINGEMIDFVGESIDVNQVAKMIKKRLLGVTPKIGINIVNYADFIKVDYEEAFGEDAEGFDPKELVPTNQTGIVVIDINSTRPSYGKLELYDLIVGVNGVRVTTIDELSAQLLPIVPGNSYTLEVYRKNQISNLFELLEIEIIIP